ncbi:MAG: 30S ribosomal protein S12 methylthiotransferase RimO [Candidatus Omnitrophica bacterium]|nr:30S ribosomal protein S12 methylthiotransferase RimO [Candidatus Omnitrophota bacterium]
MSRAAQPPRVGLLTLGCARNLVDSEVALGGLLKAGYGYAPDVKRADIAVINTCAFTESAKKESIDAILELVELKKKNKIRSIVVMGCLSQRYGTELSKDISELDVVVGTDSFGGLAGVLEPLRLSHISGEHAATVAVTPRPQFLLDQFSPRKSLTPDHTCYIKISEGCLNACSYCAIPSMKGRHRSRTIEDILAEALDRAKTGKLREINLIGQDTAAFGFDRGRVFELPNLLDRLARELPTVWIRPLYAHPAHVTPELVEVFGKHDNICRYLDLPIEHSHPDMLKRMNRGVSRETMDAVIRDFRRIPDMVLRTAVIVGFPGETEAEFEDLLDYMRDIKFERLGAFTYSREEGTRAFAMESQISDELKQERFKRVMEVQESITADWNASRIGRTIPVLIDEKASEKDLWIGRSSADAPEVDGEVLVRSRTPLKIGQFVDALVTDAMDHDLFADAKTDR